MTNDFYPFAISLPRFDYAVAHYQNGFNYDEIKSIIDLGEAADQRQAVIGGAMEGKALTDTRKSTVAFLEPRENTQWLFERIGMMAVAVNKDYFGFDLSGVFALQYTVYDNPGAHYDWHIDCMGKGKPLRKLSMVIQLSHPLDYDGGELMISGYNSQVVPKEFGVAHFFPSFSPHRVTPVTRGVRRTLVGWFIGPEFR
jgi:PKHD-type hydroxylase